MRYKKESTEQAWADWEKRIQRELKQFFFYPTTSKHLTKKRRKDLKERLFLLCLDSFQLGLNAGARNERIEMIKDLSEE